MHMPVGFSPSMIIVVFKDETTKVQATRVAQRHNMQLEFHSEYQVGDLFPIGTVLDLNELLESLNQEELVEYADIPASDLRQQN